MHAQPIHSAVAMFGFFGFALWLLLATGLDGLRRHLKERSPTESVIFTIRTFAYLLAAGFLVAGLEGFNMLH